MPLRISLDIGTSQIRLVTKMAAFPKMAAKNVLDCIVFLCK